MACCEKCWGDAFLRMLADGRSQSEHYDELCIERAELPCTPLEQRGQVQCPHCEVVYVQGELHVCADTQESEPCA